MKNNKEKPKDKLVVDHDTYITSVPKDTGMHVKREVQGEMKAFIPGQILDIMVKEGQAVSEGDTLLILEAMKMRNRIYADCTGNVSRILVKKNERVVKGQLLIVIKTEE